MLKFQHLHDDQTLNKVIRIINRRSLLSLAVLPIILMFIAVTIFNEMTVEAVKAAWDTEDYGTPLAFGVCGALISWWLWSSAKKFGGYCHNAFIPLNTAHPDKMDGVCQGNAVVMLSDDAVGWLFDDWGEEKHLSQFYSSWCRKGFLLLQSTLAEVSYMASEDAKLWLKTFRQNKKTVSNAGWALPEETGNTRHYDLKPDVYRAERSRGKDSVAPTDILWPYIFSVGLWLVAYTIISFNFIQAETYTARSIGFFVVLTFFLLLVLKGDVRNGLIGWRRRRQKLTVDGRDLHGVTHGKTALSITKDGIEISRTFCRQQIRWGAIKSVDLWDGWLVLRAGKHTLAIVPDTTQMRDAIEHLNLQPPTGPWGTSDAAITWTRAA